MKINKRVAVALLGGLAVAGVAGASAASLGGLDSESLGSDDQVVAACDGDGIDVAYTTSYDAGDDRYEVTAVELSDVAETCDGLALDVTLSGDHDADTGTADEILTSESTTSGEGSFSVALTAPISAEALKGISIVISG